MASLSERPHQSDLRYAVLLVAVAVAVTIAIAVAQVDADNVLRRPVPRSRSSRHLELDCRSTELIRNGRRIGLQGQPFRVLTLLLEDAGEVVTREQLRRLL